METNRLKEALEYIANRDAEKLMQETVDGTQLKTSIEFEQRMEKLIEKTNRQYVSLGKYTVRRVVLVVLIAVLALTGCVGIKPIREAILNYWYKITDINTTVYLQWDATGGSERVEVLKIVPPDGYCLVAEDLNEEFGYYRCEYVSPNGEKIYYNQEYVENFVANINTENANVYQMDIKGQIVTCVVKGGIEHIYWIKSSCYYHLMGECDIAILAEIIEDSL